jgi:hypothetical protein
MLAKAELNINVTFVAEAHRRAPLQRIALLNIKHQTINRNSN